MAVPPQNLFISIHPPRVGWDEQALKKAQSYLNFNPPTPCGVGLAYGGVGACPTGFQSTHPVWGGTEMQGNIGQLGKISIHPPRVGWDGPAV